jgi:hypothetical protein
VELGTIIGENALLNMLHSAKKVEPLPRKKDRGLRNVRVRNVWMDFTAVCEDECTVMGLLISDLFDVMERFPGLVAKLKEVIGVEVLDHATSPQD